MREELENKLRELAPTILKDMWGTANQTCMHWGIECGDGWFELLKELLIALEALNDERAPDEPKAYAEQIKEKFGELRFYLAAEDAEMESLIEEATQTSRVTCESCGNPGKREARKGWISVLCNECRVER